MTYSATPEQQAIIDATGRVIRANAFAGTGKSTTLRGYAAARPGERGLLVCFNKSIQLESEATFPANVRCRTAHALAFPQFGRLYTSGSKLQADIKPFHVSSALESFTRLMPQNTSRIFEQRVIETIKAYLVSADADLGTKHVVLGNSPAEDKYIAAQSVLKGAMLVWGRMQDVNDSMPMLHDGYLKLYQLSEPRLAYDFIAADEWQDANPVLQAIIDRQKGKILYTGDSHQSIYRFRGASNSMETLNADQSFYITGSFRFGPEVAEIANRILALKGERVQLRGLGSRATVHEAPYEDIRGSAFISRSNAAIFNKAHEAVQAGVPVAFVGGIGTYKFEIGEEISRLKQGGPSEVRNAFIASFSSFESLAEYAEAVGDRELSGWAKVVDRYGPRFERVLSGIRGAALQHDGHDASQSNALVVVTAHRSKGLEFDRVELAPNFIETIDEETGKLKDFGRASAEDVEEINLLYVAATRARKELVVNDSIKPLFDPDVAESAPRQAAA